MGRVSEACRWDWDGQGNRGQAARCGVFRHLVWDAQVGYLCNKASMHLYFLTLLRHVGISPADIVYIFSSVISLIRSVPEYGCEVWHPGLIDREQSDALEHTQKRPFCTAYPHLGYDKALFAASLSHLNDLCGNACCALFEAMLVPSQTPLSHSRAANTSP